MSEGNQAKAIQSFKANADSVLHQFCTPVQLLQMQKKMQNKY